MCFLGEYQAALVRIMHVTHGYDLLLMKSSLQIVRSPASRSPSQDLATHHKIEVFLPDDDILQLSVKNRLSKLTK
jgi:hypothetical protein